MPLYVAFLEQRVAKLVRRVLLLYLVVSSALERGSCNSEKRAAKMHLAVSCSSHIFWTLYPFSNNHGRSFRTMYRDRELAIYC